MPLAQTGLALATSIGAWINLTLVIIFAWQAGRPQFDAALNRSLGKLALAGLALTAALVLTEPPIADFFRSVSSWREETTLAVLAAVGAVVYSAAVLALFGRRWLAALRQRPRGDLGVGAWDRAAVPPAPPSIAATGRRATTRLRRHGRSSRPSAGG